MVAGGPAGGWLLIIYRHRHRRAPLGPARARRRRGTAWPRARGRRKKENRPAKGGMGERQNGTNRYLTHRECGASVRERSPMSHVRHHQVAFGRLPPLFFLLAQSRSARTRV